MKINGHCCVSWIFSNVFPATSSLTFISLNIRYNEHSILSSNCNTYLKMQIVWFKKIPDWQHFTLEMPSRLFSFHNSSWRYHENSALLGRACYLILSKRFQLRPWHSLCTGSATVSQDLRGLHVRTLALQLMTLLGGVRLTAPTFLTFQLCPESSTLYNFKVDLKAIIWKS